MCVCVRACVLVYVRACAWVCAQTHAVTARLDFFGCALLPLSQRLVRLRRCSLV